jgi:NADH:ubiquinone oxidoreductase subunit 4 (subunit M)
MIVVPILLTFFSPLSLKSLVLAIFFHGFSSPLLFSCVGHAYSIFQTRQLSLLRGLVTVTPLFSFILLLGFFFTLCVPPFPSFVSESFFFISSLLI